MKGIFTDPSEPDPASDPQQTADLQRKLPAIFVAIGLTIVGVVSALIVAHILSSFLTKASVWRIVVLTIGTELGFGIVAAMYLQRWSSGVEIRAPRGIRLIGLATVALFVLNRGLLLLLHTAGFDFNYLLVGTLGAKPVSLLVMAVVSMLLVGPAEELLFRGVIQDRLGHAFGPIGAIAITSLLFAPLHVESGPTVVLAANLGFVFVSSVVFGYLYEHTSNLTNSILAHGLFDAAIFASVYLSLI